MNNTCNNGGAMNNNWNNTTMNNTCNNGGAMNNNWNNTTMNNTCNNSGAMNNNWNGGTMNNNRNGPFNGVVDDINRNGIARNNAGMYGVVNTNYGTIGATRLQNAQGPYGNQYINPDNGVNYNVMKGTAGEVYNPQTQFYMASTVPNKKDDDSTNDSNDPTKAGGKKCNDKCETNIRVEIEESASSDSSIGSTVGSEIESEGEHSVFGGEISESSDCCEEECEEKCCQNITVHVPEFCILPLIYEENPMCDSSGSSILPPPILGSSEYPFINYVSGPDGSGNITWEGYDLQTSSQSGWTLTHCTEVYPPGEYIWGHGPNNNNYYIGNNFTTDGSGNDTTPINYINYIFGDDPSPADIAAADQSNFNYLNPRGYLITDFIGSGDKIYNFQFRLALKRIKDTSPTSSTPPWRYYVEFQRLDVPGSPTYPTLPAQIMTFNTTPEIGAEMDVVQAPDSSFGYTPGQTFRVALWGQQGPWSYSRRSHSCYVYATPAELNIVVADEQAQIEAQNCYSASSNCETLDVLNKANTKLATDNQILVENYPKIRVWPSTESPISLNAWIGMPCPEMVDVYYICKFSVNAQYSGVNAPLVITSRSRTRPIGSPISYYHYDKTVRLQQWSVSPGRGTIIDGTEITNPFAVEGWRCHPGTVGYLRFVPVVSNNTYDCHGNITGKKIPTIPFNDDGFLLAVEGERVRGANIRDLRTNEWNNQIFFTRNFPWPAGISPEYFGNGSFQIEPFLLHKSSYKLLPKIDMDAIGTTPGADWNLQPNTYYTNRPSLTQGFSIAGNVITPSHAATGQFVYSTAVRRKNDVDNNTVIVKLRFPKYT
jgi:hypothetical protein